jgi:hypothetical protein
MSRSALPMYRRVARLGLLDVEVFRLAVAGHRHHVELHLALAPAAIPEDHGKVAVDAAPDLAAFADAP